MFHRNTRLVLAGMVGGVLVEGFATNIAKSFFLTGRLRDQGVRRLKQNNRHMLEIFMPGGMEKHADGWTHSIRVRLVHAKLRYLLANSDEWDTEELGIPLSAAHLGFAISSFSARLLKHLRSLGGSFDEEERKSFMAVWRYSGYLMGIPETILFRDEEEALEIFRIGRICEPPLSMESIVMASSLINSAPLFAGLDDRTSGRRLAGYIAQVSRALIGNELADELAVSREPDPGVPVEVPSLESNRSGEEQAEPQACQGHVQPGDDPRRIDVRRAGHQLQIAGPYLCRTVVQVVGAHS